MATFAEEVFPGWPVGEPLPAISIRQPWAAAVVWLGKDIENRSRWLYGHRGPLIVHASATKCYREDFEEMLALARQDGVEEDVLRHFSPEKVLVDLVPQGAIVGVANLASVFSSEDEIPEDHPANASPWASDDSEHWLYFDGVIPVEPVPFKGRVGLFKVPYEVATKLEHFKLE